LKWATTDSFTIFIRRHFSSVDICSSSPVRGHRFNKLHGVTSQNTVASYSSPRALQISEVRKLRPVLNETVLGRRERRAGWTRNACCCCSQHLESCPRVAIIFCSKNGTFPPCIFQLAAHQKTPSVFEQTLQRHSIERPISNTESSRE
jgi:hypothetical protein